jgi:hypothetical protein
MQGAVSREKVERKFTAAFGINEKNLRIGIGDSTILIIFSGQARLGFTCDLLTLTQK